MPLVSHTFPSTSAFCDALFEFLDVKGQQRYDEAVTQIEHAGQTAALAEEADASGSLIVAGLLHDIGHLLVDDDPSGNGTRPGHQPSAGDDHHEAVGAQFLHRYLGTAVATPVALHVAAKRCLVTVDPTYAAVLSPASVASLEVQGGPMTPEVAEQFLARPYAGDSVRLRRWDDGAKRSDVSAPPLPHWYDLVLEHAEATRRTDR